MARISYDDRAAAAFAMARQLPPAGAHAVAQRHPPAPSPATGMRVLDLGAGTGRGRRHMAGSFDVAVVAVEPAAVLDSYPSVEAVLVAFAAAGFRFAALEPVPQVTADSQATAPATLRRDAHTPLPLITDSAYATGLTKLRAAAAERTGPVIDVLDLLVLHVRRRPARPVHDRGNPSANSAENLP